jgi:hypothetical protein
MDPSTGALPPATVVATAPPAPASASHAIASADGVPAAPAPGNGTRRAQVIAELESSLAKARAQERADLVGRLEAAQRDLDEHDLPVVVAGEFKQGKSSLVNGLVQTAVCPVDDDVVTAVPTVVRFGREAEAMVHLAPDASQLADRAGNRRNGAPSGDEVDGDQVPPLPIPLGEVPRWVRGEVAPDTELLQSAVPGATGGTAGTASDRAQPRVRSVEVRLNRKVLRSGLSFVDCPGVGGLESAEGSITLGALTLAQGLLFVTDAAQELTRAEVTFLKAARQRCSRVACVVTKIDLYPEWRRIVELDEGHLAREGLDVPVIPVSSFLRLRAADTKSQALNEESLYPALFTYLRREVAEQGDAGQVEHVAREVAFAKRLLRRSLQAESDVIARPEQAVHVVQRLSQAAAATEALRSSGAQWQRVLADGIQDLVEDVKHDLRDRLRKALQMGIQVIERSDPKDSWAEFETWIRRQVVTEVVATYDFLQRRAVELAEQVGQQFTREADTPIALSINAPIAALERIQLDADFTNRSGGKANVALSAARGSYGGILMFGMAGSLLGIPIVGQMAVLVGLGLGGKSLRDELKRRHQVRQQQGKEALRQYVDKVSFTVDKECRDALRRTQRQLRDEFTARAQSLHQSSALALAQAEQALTLPPQARDQRRQVVERELADLGMVAVPADAVGGAT